MADEDEKSGPLAKVRIDPLGGGEMSVSDKLPGVIGRMLPVSLVGRRNARRALYDRVIPKLHRGDPLTEAEAEWACSALGPDEASFVRLEQITTRAAELVKELPPASTAPAGELPAATEEAQGEAQAKSTSDDWVNRFRDDAGLVDDETLREIYSRVLAGEAQRPGSVSLRTLGTLRYLDEETANRFALLMKVVFDGRYVPEQRPSSDHVLAKLGLVHPVLVTLTEAGLLNANIQTETSRHPEKHHVFRLNGHCRLLFVKSADESSFPLRFSVHMLTRAGMDLARVAQIPEDPGALDQLIQWFGERMPHKTYSVAKLPHPQWGGKLDQLDWSEPSTWPG